MKYLGGAIGSKDCVENASKEKVLLWIEKLMFLSSVAKLYSQAAYNVILDFFCTIECSEAILQNLEDAIQLHLIPSLTDRGPPGDIERDILSLPTSMGGLGIPKPHLFATLQFFCISVCEPLIHLLSNQLENSQGSDVLDTFLSSVKLNVASLIGSGS